MMRRKKTTMSRKTKLAKATSSVLIEMGLEVSHAVTDDRPKIRRHARVTRADVVAKSVMADMAGLGGTESLAKAYGGDWLTQFSGSALFDEAAKLCDAEIASEEKRLAERIADRKKRHKSPRVTSTNETSWDKQDKLRLKKQKLELRLAKEREKRLLKTS